MTDFEDHDISFNPTIDSLIKIIGRDAMADLSKDLGGSRIYIPYKPGAHSPLSVSIGLDAAKKIAQTYGGMDFTVPVSIGKDAEIRELHEKGFVCNLFITFCCNIMF